MGGGCCLSNWGVICLACWSPFVVQLLTSHRQPHPPQRLSFLLWYSHRLRTLTCTHPDSLSLSHIHTHTRTHTHTYMLTALVDTQVSLLGLVAEMHTCTRDEHGTVDMHSMLF